ncbi:MAG TPA: futalosine hydrolase [Vicinamibacterales bacterium]|nr:futalosine hydrolase [Vicinamibacterales bacterium]
MRILVVAATEPEIPLPGNGRRGDDAIDVLVTGVGMVATAARCAQALARSRYDVAYNFGICGAFDRSIALGAVVHVVSDCVPELGAEDGHRFVPLHELGLAADHGVLVNEAPPANDVLRALPAVRGITVNTVHGRDESIAAIVERLSPQVESMEGAAFAYACTISGVAYAQVRAVSNIVERRNRGAWRLDLAIRNLHDTARRILDFV